jgi:hypothetical protein
MWTYKYLCMTSSADWGKLKDKLETASYPGIIHPYLMPNHWCSSTSTHPTHFNGVQSQNRGNSKPQSPNCTLLSTQSARPEQRIIMFQCRPIRLLDLGYKHCYIEIPTAQICLFPTYRPPPSWPQTFLIHNKLGNDSRALLNLQRSLWSFLQIINS